jgi:pimeloyl-ACP methyl ester carboxylesterase
MSVQCPRRLQRGSPAVLCRITKYALTCGMSILVISATLSAQPLRMDLKPGPYKAGFRTIDAYDNSRIWRDLDSPPSRTSRLPHTRPIRISLWFPAKRIGRPMSYRDYLIYESKDPEFAAFSALIAKRDMGYLSGLVGPSPGEKSRLLAIPMMASAQSVIPASGRFPVVLYFMGLNDLSSSNVILCEYLATQGFVVVTVPQLGPESTQIDLGLSAYDLETQLRDMEFALSVIRSLPFVDSTRVASIGHSIGGIAAVLMGTRNSDVKAIVALDASYGSDRFSPLLLQAVSFQGEKLSVPLLDIRRAESQAELPALKALSFSPISSIGVEGVFHGDFTSTPLVEALFPGNVEGRTQESVKAPVEFFKFICHIATAFMKNALSTSSSSFDVRLWCDLEKLSSVKVTKCNFIPARPTLKNLAKSVRQDGLKNTLSRYESEMTEARMNSIGYMLASQGFNSEAIEVLQANVQRHTQSANTYDSLADIQAQTGALKEATQNYGTELEMIERDPKLSEDTKEGQKERVRKQLEMLARQATK